MTLTRSLLTSAAVCGVALLTVVPASARTICRPDGYCFNTSGAPVYDQPAYHDYGYGGYYPQYRYGGYPYHRRHWHNDYDRY
jgi:hypothetical protein